MSKNIERERETNKIGLETFFFSIENINYNKIIDDAVNTYEQKLLDLKNAKIDYSNIEDSYDKYAYSNFIESQLFSISEMRIIHLYKIFENKLKFLIRAAYNVDIKMFYKWENITQFLKTKNIDIKKIQCYNDINELRLINNSLKHSDNLKKDNSVKNIKEIKNSNYIKYQDLLEFYKRVENAPEMFITDIADNFFRDLYVFDEQRLDEIAEKIALRMTKEHALTFIEKLKSKY